MFNPLDLIRTTEASESGMEKEAMTLLRSGWGLAKGLLTGGAGALSKARSVVKDTKTGGPRTFTQTWQDRALAKQLRRSTDKLYGGGSLSPMDVKRRLATAKQLEEAQKTFGGRAAVYTDKAVKHFAPAAILGGSHVNRRLNQRENQDAIAAKAREGGYAGAADALHSQLLNPGLQGIGAEWEQALSVDPDRTRRFTAGYTGEMPTAPKKGLLGRVGALMDPVGMIPDAGLALEKDIFTKAREATRSLTGAKLDKSASEDPQGICKEAMAKKLLTWGGRLFTAGVAAEAAHKVYKDSTADDEKGAYDAAYDMGLGAAAERLDNLTWTERMALQVDPTLALVKMRKEEPEVFKAYERKHGITNFGPLARRQLEAEREADGTAGDKLNRIYKDTPNGRVYLTQDYFRRTLPTYDPNWKPSVSPVPLKAEKFTGTPSNRVYKDGHPASFMPQSYFADRTARESSAPTPPVVAGTSTHASSTPPSYFAAPPSTTPAPPVVATTASRAQKPLGYSTLKPAE